MNALEREYFAYLVKQHLEVQYQWTDGPQEVTLKFLDNGKLTSQKTMAIFEAREFWHTMITKLGYAKGVKCSTHLIK